MDHNWWLNKGMNTKWPEHLDLGRIERNLPKIQVELTLLVVLHEQWLDLSYPRKPVFFLPATLPLQKLPTACHEDSSLKLLEEALREAKNSEDLYTSASYLENWRGFRLGLESGHQGRYLSGMIHAKCVRFDRILRGNEN